MLGARLRGLVRARRGAPGRRHARLRVASRHGPRAAADRVQGLPRGGCAAPEL